MQEEIKEESVQASEVENTPTPNVDSSKSVSENMQEQSVSPESENTNDKGKKFKKHDKELEKVMLENQKLLLERQAISDKYLRLNAEMQNMLRRTDMEKANLCKYDGEKLLKQILPIIDNFERAISLDNKNTSEDVNKFLSGVKMIYTSLLSVIESYGVKEIDALDKEFDPSLMEAIMTEHDENKKPGIVLDVMQKGYMYKDKVIRHAMVKVSE